MISSHMAIWSHVDPFQGTVQDCFIHAENPQRHTVGVNPILHSSAKFVLTRKAQDMFFLCLAYDILKLWYRSDKHASMTNTISSRKLDAPMNWMTFGDFQDVQFIDVRFS